MRPCNDLRCARFLVEGQTDLPDGGLVIFVSSARTKNISFPRLVETDLLIPPSRSTEGRIAIVTDAGWDAVDARSVCSLPRKGEGIETRRGCLKFESVNELSERFRSGLVRPSRSLFSSAVSGLSADAARPWRLAPATVP